MRVTHVSDGSEVGSVRVSDEGPVRWILLDRPERLNAVDLPAALEWAKALEEAASDGSVRAVVLAGEGRAFCSGGDLRAFREVEDRQGYLSSVAAAIAEGVKAIRSMDKVVIAAVHGHAVGVGFSLFLASDIKLVAEGTKLAMSYVNVGLTPGGGGTWLLPRLTGHARATEIFLTGRTITAKAALDLGIVNRVVAPDELRGEAQKLGEDFAEGPPEAIARTKELLWRAQVQDLDAHLALEARTIGEAAVTAEFEEGSLAFFERRPPKFG
jgi:2-(1,2-epoxy-1,2-dihydrophenyl)acetyl-CoA isomerase